MNRPHDVGTRGLPIAVRRARCALTMAWRRSREPVARGAASPSNRVAWTFLGWITLVGLSHALARWLH